MAQLQWICLQCRRPRFDRWVGKIPWRKERLPSPVFWPGEFHWLYSPWGCKESDTTEWLSLSLLYNIVMVFAIHQHELTIGIHMSPPSWTPLPFANIFKTKEFHTHTHTRMGSFYAQNWAVASYEGKSSGTCHNHHCSCISHSITSFVHLAGSCTYLSLQPML